jgi:hypothetical protein
MAYHNAQRERYTIPSVAFGATTTSQVWKGPAGKKGYVRDIIVYLTADAVGTTTVPEVTVGSSAGDTTYARFRLGTAAGTGYTAAASPYRARNLVTGNGAAQTLSDFTGHVSLETSAIPSDTAFYVSGKAGVGGTPAGTGIIHVDIDWF